MRRVQAVCVVAHKRKRTLAGPFFRTVADYFLLPPLRPGLPGTPPASSFERNGLPWFELPGSQPSGPLPTPRLHFVLVVPPMLPLVQPTKATLVRVTSALASDRPSKGEVGATPVAVMAA